MILVLKATNIFKRNIYVLMIKKYIKNLKKLDKSFLKLKRKFCLMAVKYFSSKLLSKNIFY